MKKMKLIIICFFILLVCGCSKKFDGTWCLYVEVPSSLVILNDNVSNDDISVITKYLDSIKNISSFDLIDNIESANKMINIYYFEKDGIDSIKNTISNYSFVKSVENKMINKAKEKIVVNKKAYVYGKDLNSLYAIEIKGNIKTKNDVLILDADEFYYKDKFLCGDKDCSIIYTKSDNDCAS